MNPSAITRSPANGPGTLLLMTPVTLMALADQNSQDYLSRLIDCLHSCAHLHTEHLQLQVHILSDLYDIADDSFEARQIQHVLKQRQQQQAQCYAQLKQASQDAALSTQTLREHQAKLDQDLQQALGESSQSPAMRECQHELQQAQDAREPLKRDHLLLSQECTQKLASYVRHPMYRYLRQQGFASTTYRRNALNRFLDEWLAKHCNFSQNLRNEQLLNAMQQHSAAQLAEHDKHIGALEQRLEDLRKALTQQPVQAKQVRRIETLANQVIDHWAQVEPLYLEALRYARCEDEDGQDALRWLKYELKAESLEAALAQWAAIGSPQPERYRRELLALRQRLDIATEQINEALDALRHAEALEFALRTSMSPFACTCGAQSTAPARCTCHLLLPTGERYAPRPDYASLIDSYMNRALLLGSLINTIKAARLAPATAPEHTVSDTLSPAPQLMQGHP